MLRFEKVRFSYPGRPVFDGLDLTLPDGSRTALLAPSGTGKTTLLRLLTGQLRPQSGAVTGIPAEGIAMVFQGDRLLPGRTALENLRFVRPGPARGGGPGAASGAGPCRLGGQPPRQPLRRDAAAGWPSPGPSAFPAGCWCWMSRSRASMRPPGRGRWPVWTGTPPGAPAPCDPPAGRGQNALAAGRGPLGATGVCPAVPPAETP